MKSIFCLSLLCLLLLPGCNNKKQQLSKLVEAWQGKEIIFPDSLESRIFGRDTLCREIFEKEYKILNYIDTNGCTECQLKLFDWQMLKEELDSLECDVALVFVAWTNDYEKLEILQSVNRFDTPIFYDRKGRMDSLNQFPSSSLFHTFLLDRNNRVVLVGSPLGNEKLWDLYKKRIQARQDDQDIQD